MKTKTFFIFLSLITASFSAFGQSQSIAPSVMNSATTLDLMRTILLDEDSKSEKVMIEINEGTQSLELLIRSSVNQGKLTIEIYDSNDTKQGNFTVETLSDSDKEEYVQGKFKKTLIDPQHGKWKIHIIPTKATGNIEIQTTVSQ